MALWTVTEHVEPAQPLAFHRTSEPLAAFS
jgi:hypothetical protein